MIVISPRKSALKREESVASSAHIDKKSSEEKGLTFEPLEEEDTATPRDSP